MPQQDNRIELEFKDIRYSVSEGFFKGRKDILHGISGIFRSGHLSAIIGHSGAGKTTLMNILAGYRVKDARGAILVNGRERCLKAFKRSSAYIMQDDHCHRHLTIRESLVVASNLKMDSRCDRREKDRKINYVLKRLNLEYCQNTRASRLSSGERKRLCLAVELIGDPSVMFFDEPTSGLDSVNSYQCISLLKSLADHGKIIICTIHQPSAKIFETFDYLLAISEGHCVYRGYVTNLVPFLSSVGLQCPKYHNPADYLMEVIAEEKDKVTREIASKFQTDDFHSASEMVENWKNKAGDDLKDVEAGGQKKEWSSALALMEANGIEGKKPNVFLSNNNGDSRITLTSEGNVAEYVSPYMTSQLKQFCILYKRTNVYIIRDWNLIHLPTFVTIILGLLVGGLYYGIGSDPGSFYYNTANLFFCVLFLMFTAMMSTILSCTVMH